MKRAFGIAVLLALPAPARPQDDAPRAHAKVDQVRVNDAIKRGEAYLKRLCRNLPMSEGHGGGQRSARELVLLTLLNSGLPENDPEFQYLLKDMLERKLEATYCVSLQAMVLEELDRVKYQWRLQQCAQFLIDNQCSNGQWNYGAPSIFVEDIPTGGEGGAADVATSGSKTRPLQDVPTVSNR